ncbi:MAG: formimidoylglutamate deiminase [Ilumatobacteraceae bacterium]
MTARYWCESAWLGGDSAADSVLVSVDGGRITAVEARIDRPADAVALRGVVLPGLANAHSHAFHRALRGRTQTGTGSFWTWREQMYAAAASLQPDLYGRLARAVFAEMAMAGITCVGEFHYLHHQPGGTPYADPNEMGHALAAAAAEAGVRLTLLDTCYLHGGIGIAPNALQRRFSDGSAERWAARVAALRPGAGLRIGVAIHSVRAVDPGAIGLVAAWAAAEGRVLHAHVSEQPAENAQCRETFGLSPVALLAARGALGPAFTAVHATHLDDADIDRLGASGSTVCLCPTTERDLADGIGGASALHAAGARLALGSDSHAMIDLLEEARAVELDERLLSGRRGLHAVPALLEAATASGHRSLGWAEAGRLAVGALADLVTLRLDSVRTAGLDVDSLLAGAVYAATAADVSHVLCGGRLVVSEGRHCSLDVPRELAAAIRDAVTAA